jgi:hypothetical protein
MIYREINGQRKDKRKNGNNPIISKRKTDLKQNTKDAYMSKANIVHRLFTGMNLSSQLEEELFYLFHNQDLTKHKSLMTWII